MRETKLFICLNEASNDWHEVDLFDTIGVTANYSVQDIKDITKTRGTYSGTIRIPNTKNNAWLFGFTHEIASWSASFEMLKNYPAFVQCEGVRTLNGEFRLMRVNIGDDRVITYEGQVVDNVIQFANRLGNTTLRGNSDPSDDLSFSDYIFPLSESNMLDLLRGYHKQWGTCLIDKTDKFKQPLLQYSKPGGALFKRVPWYWDEPTPYLRLKDVFDRIFDWAGFNYVSDFITGHDTDFCFAELIYPHASHNSKLVMGDHNSVISQVVAADIVGTSAYMSGQMYYSPFNQISFNANFTLAETDPMQQLAPWRLAPTVGGRYSVNLNFVAELQVQFYKNNPPIVQCSNETVVLSSAYTGSTDLSFGIQMRNAGNLHTYHEVTDTPGLNDSYSVDANGWATVSVIEMDEDMFMFNDGSTSYAMTTRYAIPCWDAVNTWPFEDGNGTPVRPYNARVVIRKKNVGDPFITVKRTSDWYINGLFDPTCILNPKTKKMDFISSIFKKFNLYAEDVSGKPDGNGGWYLPKTIRIEPHDTYYDTDRHDWNGIIDRESVEFSRIDTLVDKVLVMKDKCDDDYWIKTYNDVNDLQYGEVNLRGHLCTNRDNEVKIESIFGQTVCGPMCPQTLFVEMPKLVTFSDGQVDAKKEYSDRFFFKTMVNSMYPPNNAPQCQETITLMWRSMYIGNELEEEFLPVTTDQQLRNKSQNFMYETQQFPIVDNFNRPYGYETGDLNFGESSWHYQYRMAGWYTANTIYNHFYRKMVDELSAPESRLLSCKAFISPTEMSLLKMSDSIIFENQLWRINKISGWSNTNLTASVELIKVVDMPSVSATGAKSAHKKLGRGASVTDAIGTAAEAAETAEKAAEIASVNTEEIANLSARLAELEKLVKNRQ